jgi:hypothetical protein
VEGVAGVQDARPPGGRAGEFHRALDGLGSRVGRHHRRNTCRRTLDERLRERAREHAHAELGEVRAVRVQQLAQGGDHVGVAAADREGPVAAQQVEVARAVGVDQVRALAVCPDTVEAERAHDPPELGVQVAVVQLHCLTGARSQHVGDGSGNGGHVDSLRAGRDARLHHATLTS